MSNTFNKTPKTPFLITDSVSGKEVFQKLVKEGGRKEKKEERNEKIKVISSFTFVLLLVIFIWIQSYTTHNLLSMSFKSY